ncbi:helix-turn-helix domain-containing protein [Brachybacterium kimchii]|uniref:Helix-turn-helix transcriptional regulator n=1 Tax=Brachybacterium kimchii TaxID=2942909 RepID=A0ABY4N812_9MICO|nr:helix-turn-helix transcriptional regulator [Brachybacterium kimchii]UQN30693.1 helix-turn-helix transcriptional regulator [Brachybacterium kimchii]
MHLVTTAQAVGAIWMELIDRDKLVRRMKKLGVSQRELARAAGWKSHSYMRRLITGEAKTLNTDPALRIAYRLQLDVDDIFVTRVSTPATQLPAPGKRPLVETRHRTAA